MAEGALSTASAEEIYRLNKLSPFAELIGLKIDKLAENYCRLKLFLEDKCVNYSGIIHGGVIAAMSDTCMGIALRTVGLKPLTAELTVNFLSSPRAGDELTAEGWIIHHGNTLILTECTVKKSSDNTNVARGRGIFVSNRLLPSGEKKGS